ncbi:hypothetical protein QMK19_19400 [Streptomyces sp. H10-C2]|uniref:hypothetical protein n=1 Tax=unclassified Streptomyces TaxID=2593676 RepID=UPI0024B9875F|nr:MULTISPECIES: hypothetical protein [unclassified Streptomyces]MDJ0343405.1 hypothetical protein [Streptomyces sp. PH10-H1]MDJ0371784.1 hypothetical protein [Streptomyces sp. H10-C2]
MGNMITVDRQGLGRSLTQWGDVYGASYQRDFASLARSHRGRPVAEILPLLGRAADSARLVFAAADLAEQAEAISAGTPYELHIA